MSWNDEIAQESDEIEVAAAPLAAVDMESHRKYIVKQMIVG
jgi:hypothetical protein